MDAAMVVIDVLIATARAVPVGSVIVVAGLIVPAPIVNVTGTFGTPSPVAVNTVAATLRLWSAREAALSTICVGVVDTGLDGSVGTGGWYASHPIVSIPNERANRTRDRLSACTGWIR
jgi:hypothetical protein